MHSKQKTQSFYQKEDIMKKKTKLVCKILSVFLTILLVLQIAPMQIIADAYAEATIDENTENTLGVSLDDIDTTEPEAEILAEETSKREQYVKHFRMSDGSYRATQYEVPVHFIQDGEWTDYDNTLTEVDADTEDGESASNKDLTNTLADYSVRLSKKTNGKKFVRIEKDGYKLSWYYTKANKVTAQITEITDDGDETTLEKLSSQVIYENVYTDTDFEYIVGSEGLKENIILKSEDTQTVFEAEYKANGLTPVQVDDKTIELQADDGTVIYTINAPYMTDANGEYSNGITLTLSSVKNNKFTVTTTLDEDWLDDYDRAYPVTVDPVIKTQQEYGEMDSTFVGNLYPNRCYHTYSTDDSGSLYVGKISGYGQTESYLKVNTLPTLGVADKVVYAQLNMGLWTCELGMQLEVKRLIESWSMSSVTWNNKPEPAPSITDYIVLEGGESAEWLEFEITDLVRGWYSGEYPNYGISFSTPKTSSAKVWMFSSDFNENGLDENRPILYVNYRNMSGYENYWSYTGLSAGRSGALSVNNYNGNAIFTQPITLGDGGNLMPVSLSLVYNSNDVGASHTRIGDNFRTNFHMQVRHGGRTLYAEGYKYYLVDADGTKHWFYFKDEEGNNLSTGKDEDGLGYTLDIIEIGSDTDCEKAYFRLTDESDNRMYFDYIGKLLKIIDTNGNSVNIAYDTELNTRIETITDGAGRIYKFNYANLYSNICQSITDPAGRSVSFTYTDDYLTSITFPDGECISLAYDNGFLSQVDAIDGTRAEITYDGSSQSRVSNIKWGAVDTETDELTPLESYSFEYMQNETTITEIQGREYTYQFNDLGQTTGIISNEDGKAQYFDYVETESKTDLRANKLVSESKVLHSVTNYVVNPGFSRALSGTYSTGISDSTGTPTITIDETKGNLTDSSVKIYKPAENTGYVYAYQTFSGLSAGTYTFSCYANTFGGTTAGKGLYVGYRIMDEDNNFLVTKHAEDIHTTDDWERISMTFDIEEGQKARILVGFSNGSVNGSGTVWFDDLQLEKSSGTSSYNLLENSGFSNEKVHWSSKATLNTISDLPGFTKAISKVGSPTEEWLGLSQFIYESGKKGDVFGIGAWIKADSAPINDLKTEDTYSPRFALALHFYDSSGTCLKSEEIAINDDLTSWQFVSGKVIAPVDYAKLCFEVIYYSNVNTVMMTGGFCFKEEYGQTYTYDENGKVISSVDLANTQSSFAFKGDQMAKMLNPSGSRYMYSYDEDNNNLNYALSSDGQQYAFEYDDKGNVTSSEITARKPATSLVPGNQYIIVNAYSGKAMDSGSTGKLSDDTFTASYDPDSVYQQWRLVFVEGEEDVYYLTPVGFMDKDYTLDLCQAVTTDGGIVQIYSYSGKKHQMFKISKDEDNTFVIYTGSTNYSKAIDAQYEDNDLDEKQIIKQKTLPGGEPKESMKWYFYPVETTEDKTISTSATYTDNQNFVSTITDQRGNETTYNYNEAKGTLTSVIDASGNKTNYTYNGNTNALMSVTSGGMTNSYSYTDDRLTTINVDGYVRYNFTYDEFGRTTSTRVNNNKPLSTLTYNLAGLLLKQVYGNGDYISFDYDNLDRLIGKSYNDSETDRIEYFYGADGNVSNVIDYSTGTDTRYVYDLAGRLVEINDYSTTWSNFTNAKSSIEYTYADKTNHLTDIKHYNALGTQNIGYVYGNLSIGQMPDAIYKVNWNGDEKVAYTYDDLGRLTNKKINSSLNNYYSYLNVDDIRTTSMLSSLTTAAGTYSYTYDEIGNITSINDGTYTASYEYDSLNQLVRENDQRANKTYVYVYRNGNIIAKREYAYTVGELGDALSTKMWIYSNSAWADLLTNWNGRAITYDAIGNPLRLGTMIMTWQGRQLQTISIGTNTYAFDYNMDGQRVSKTFTTSSGEVTKTEYYYNGSILAGEKTGDNIIIYMYDNNGNIFGFTYNGTEYYYIKNAQNDVTAITDVNGNILVRYYYNAWGEIINCQDTSGINLCLINPITYRSYYKDEMFNTYMYYLNSRYYYPEMCRFLNADGSIQTGQGMLDKNMFAYCANNPVAFYDPTGCSAEYILIEMPAQGDGPISITTYTDEYDYYVSKEGNTYTVAISKSTGKDKVDIAEDFISDITVMALDDAVGDVNYSQIFNSASSSIKIFDKMANGLGYVSLALTGIQLLWDYETYKNAPDRMFMSMGITVVSALASALAGVGITALLSISVIAASTFAPVLGIGLAIGSGLLISHFEDKLRLSLVGETRVYDV